MDLNLHVAQDLIEQCLTWRKAQGMKPLTVAVLDSGGYLMALAREDGTGTVQLLGVKRPSAMVLDIVQLLGVHPVSIVARLSS